MLSSRTGRRARAPQFLVGIIFSLIALYASQASAQLVGTKNIPGDYADLAAAIADLNAVGVGAGGVTLNVVAANPQSVPAGGYAITTLTGSAANPILIQGNNNTATASAALTVGALNDAIFKIIGSDFVTITGFQMLENPANTVTTAASNTMTEFGVALFYTTTTDGTQNITIQGNTIDLNRTYQNTFGIYANSTHSATAVTTSATATGPTGGASNLKVYGNTITDVNIGIVVVGPTAAADHNDSIDIGGAALATGNNINNYGTTGTFSGYANVSGTVNGVLVRNSKTINVSFNTIASSNGGTTAGTLRGIYMPSFSNAPTGTYTNSFNNNNISLRSAVTAGAMNGILAETTTGTATSALQINSNDFNTTTHTVAGASGAIIFISNAMATLSQQINGNTFTNMSVNTTGSVTFIVDGVVVPATGSQQVNNNAIVTGFGKTGAGGTVTFFSTNASSVNGATVSNSNNIVSNFTLTGATAFAGIVNTDGATATNGPTKTITGNTVTAISGGTGTMTPFSVNFSGPASVVTNNTVGNISWGAATTGMLFGTSNQATLNATGNVVGPIATTAGAVVGLSTGAPTANYTSNTISALSSSGAVAVTGLAVTAGTTVNVSKNKIYDVSGSNAGSTVNGMLVSAGTTIGIFNNLIGDLRTPVASAANAINGINLTSATATSNLNLSYNTVYINATSSGANFGTSGLFHTASATGTTATLNLRNNAIVNASTPAGTGLTVAHRRSGTALNNYGAVSNNNDFYAGTPGAANLIFSDGTNVDQTLAAYKTRVATRDSNSLTENPPFTSTTGTSANFLHIANGTPTQLESTGAPIAGITDDFDGDARNASTPDVGGDEFAGVILDVTPPAISYAPFGNTTLTANRVLPATISDISGVATGATAPRIYFRKNAGTYFSSQCAGTSPNYSCTVDHGLLGGVVTGDSVSYYVIAQDLPGNVGANPGAGLVASDVNTVTTPPTTPNSYLITTGFPAAVNVGTGNPITSLTNAGGLFEAINAGVFTSNVVVTITSDLAAESGTFALNQISEEGGSGFTLTIQPDSATERLVAGAVANGMIRLNGADRVTFDGRFGGTGRFLRFRNTNTANPTFLFGNDATNNTIRASFVESANTGAASGTIVFGTGVVLGNSNNTIADSDIRDRSDAAGVPANGIFSSGTPGAANAQNVVVNCNVFNWTSGGVLVTSAGAGDGWTIGVNNFFQTAARTTALTGISVQGGNAHLIQANFVGGGGPGALGPFTATSGLFRGIDLTVGTVAPSSVQGNTVKNIRSTSTSFTASYGIFLQAGSANIGNVVGNTIGSADPNERYEINGDSYGIRVISTTAVNLRNNTVNNMTTSPTVPTGEFYFGIAVEGTGGAHTVQGNTVTNLTNGSTPDASFNTQTIGLFVSATGAQTVRNNTISNIVSSSVTLVTTLNNRVWGVIMSGTGAGTVFERNSVSGVNASTATTGARADVITGVQLQTLANATLSNNMVSLSGGGPSDRPIFGILDLNAAGPTGNYYFNSVNIFGTATTANNTYAFNRNGVANVSLRDNTFANVRTGGTGFHVAMANTNAAATGWPATASNYNIVWNVTPAHVTQWLGSLAVNNQTLAGFQTASGGDANSLNADPAFVSNADLHILPTSPAINAGTPFGGVTIDFDGQPRNATTPTIGADEIPVGNLTITPPTVNFGSQTVGSTSAPSTVTLGNNGTASLDVTFLDTANAPFARSGGSCNPTTPITIAAGSSCTLDYTFAPAASGPASQTLTVTANAPGSGTIGLSGNGVIPQSDLSITKTDGVTSVQTGSTVTYTITASNAGPSTATGATVADTPPAELTGCSWTCVGAGGGTCGSPTGGPTINDTVNLPMGGSVTYTMTCTVVSVTASSSLVNSATVTAPPLFTDPDTSNNSATDTDSVLRRVDLSVNKTDGATTEIPGTAVSYTITVGNAGPNAAAAVVTDGFGASLTGCTWTCAATNGTCTASGSGNISDAVTIASGGQLVYTANCTVASTATGTLVNAASAAFDALTYADTDTSNNSSTDVDTLNPQGDLSISINDSRQFVQVGNTLNYVILVGNTGPSTTTANVGDALPSELNAGSWVCIPFAGATCSAGSGSTLSDSPTLPPGSQVGYVFSTTVANAGTDDLIDNSAGIAGTGGFTDTNPGNNSATDSPADIVVIFKDGFESTPYTLIDLIGQSDFAQAQLSLSRAWIDRASMVPTVLFQGAGKQGVLFSVEVLRMGDDLALRVLTRDRQGIEQRTSWQRVDLGGSIVDFAWQSATATNANGYLQLRVGAMAAATIDGLWQSDSLAHLRIPVDQNNEPAARLTH